MQTICANPDDDAPRLVYADWLEENGFGPLAEFIRVQIELARIGHSRANHLYLQPAREPELGKIAEANPRLASLLRRESELWDKRVEWRRLPPRWLEHFFWNYRRGFLEEWHSSVVEFLRYCEELWSYGPVHTVHLEGKDADFEKLASSPSLDRIKRLVVEPKKELDQGGIALARSKHLKRIIEIRVRVDGVRISAQAARDMAARFGDILIMT